MILIQLSVVQQRLLIRLYVQFQNFLLGPCVQSLQANISSRTSDSIDGNDFFVIGAGSLVLMIGMALIIKHIFMDSKHCQQKPKLH